jgi:hypothetical protein
MSYDRPRSADFANVIALNREFLRILRADVSAFELGQPLAGKLLSMGCRQCEALAGAPFLLFSLQERNHALWQQLLVEKVSDDLLASQTPMPHAVTDLAVSTLGFLWQLAQRNPYAVRLLSGADAEWCNRITAAAFVDLSARVRQCPALVELREHGNRQLWNKLLEHGTSPEKRVRDAAQIAAMQCLLTYASTMGEHGWRVAACGSSMPGRRR